jgi:hypothetical protein
MGLAVAGGTCGFYRVWVERPHGRIRAAPAPHPVFLPWKGGVRFVSSSLVTHTKEHSGALLYKPDWEATKARFRTWWSHGYFGRCALGVTAPRAEPLPCPPPPEAATPEEKHHDPEWMSRNNAYRMSRTFYGGEAFPIWSDGYHGLLGLSTMLGCKGECRWDTSWAEPFLTDPSTLDVSRIRLDEGNPYCRMKRAAEERALRECPGKSIPSVGAFGGSGDTLAAMRGTEQLLFDCIERPEQVRAAEERLMDIWIDFHGRVYERLQPAAQGSTCWFSLWSPGKFYAAQNDFSFNVGPEMFRELFLPVIRRQTEYLDHSVYHVDGVDAFRHVPALCELPRLQAIQILPGAGKPSPLHYLDVLRQVQAAGKNLHISIPAAEVRQALELLSARGLFIQTSCPTEAEARQLLAQAEKWSVDRG